MRQAGQRADKFLFKILSLAPAGFVYKMIRKKNIVLNDRKMTGREILKEEDVLRIYLSDDTFDKFSCAGTPAPSRKDDSLHPDPKTLPVVYEDEHIIVMNKPAGILSQKAEAGDYSMNEWLLDYLQAEHFYDPADSAGFRPSVSNRLDRNTSGLLLGGKTIHGLQMLAELLRDRTLKKYYRAMVSGCIIESSDLEGYLVKDAGNNRVRVSRKPQGADAARIHTAYEPVAVYETVTDLKVHLITGKSHQIRAHLASIGHPLIGDPKYGDKDLNAVFRRSADIRRQMLHAWKMELPDGRVFEAGLPEDFKRLVSYFEHRA